MTAPTSATTPQFSQRPRAVVSSNVKSSRSSPAAAFPSSFRSCSSISASWRTETLGSDSLRRVAYGDEAVGDRLDEARRPADECDPLGIRIGGLAKDLLVDPARIPRPARRLLARQRISHLEMRVCGVEHVELVVVDDVSERARGVEKASSRVGPNCSPMAEHRPEWNYPRATADEEKRPALAGLPDEIAPDRPAEFELVSDDELLR